MRDLSFDEFLPRDLEAQIRDHVARGEVPFVLMRPDKGPTSRPQPIAVVFGPCVPRIGETLLWDNGELYAIVGVTHRLIADPDVSPYLRSLPLIATQPLGRAPEA